MLGKQTDNIANHVGFGLFPIFTILFIALHWNS